MGTGRRFLVSVGVGTYKDSGIPDLPGATVDAERVARLLAPMGYTRVLGELSSNPSRGALVEGLDEWAYEAELGPEDTVVVYFAGHGQKDGQDQLPAVLEPPAEPLVWVWSALANGATASTAANATNKPSTALRITSPCRSGTW
ncbi:caspase family protein [Streptomyces sp. DG2A-72]|uniref:caspase family protein n=1 Tax=Streptomyces sp. DG2A-72 TaxID=3051386 RepID=UPI00265C4A60|nr:caspase family protein [Streptomyces sp. DG2A-72]MDO0937558.1 caspase family protein [Streptomyces sp. DG2A-72]